MRGAHIDQTYESELALLRSLLVRMGARVEGMLHASTQALFARDRLAAERTMQLDLAVDELELQIDDLCLRILARRQPVASDLRFVTMVLKVVTDLERMGDLVVSICERVIELADAAPFAPLSERAAGATPVAIDDAATLPRALSALAEGAQAMLRAALDAFVDSNPDHAHAVIDRDAEVDGHYNAIFAALLTHMGERTGSAFAATRVQSIAKYMERIADHATNVAEMVVFMVHGRDIRHLGAAPAHGPRPSAPPPGDPKKG